jgi:Tol biopolymer transport system component
MALLLLAATVAVVASTLAGAFAPQEPVVLRQGFSHPSAGASVSADGRFVAFVSGDPLLPADRNTIDDIYVLDRSTHRITLETVAWDGGPANGTSAHPELSGDGRYLAFESTAANLTAADSNEASDVFVRDRLTATTRRVSRGRSGEAANGGSEAPAFSSDGRFVAFVSSATILVAADDENGRRSDVYLVRVDSGDAIRVSVDAAGRAFAASFAPRVSADGRLVVFTAVGHAGGPALEPARADIAVYVRDTVDGATSCISCNRKNGAGAAFAPDISGDGRHVAYAVASASQPQRQDIALHDRVTSQTIVVTRHANARSGAPRLSADGRIVVFESWASDLICGKRCSQQDLDDNLLPDVYLFERDAGRFRRISGASRSWWSPSRAPAIDGRGTVVVFSSRQPFGPEDATVDFDLYVCAPACQ